MKTTTEFSLDYEECRAIAARPKITERDLRSINQSVGERLQACEAILDLSTIDGRAFTADEQRQFDGIRKEADRIESLYRVAKTKFERDGGHVPTPEEQARNNKIIDQIVRGGFKDVPSHGSPATQTGDGRLGQEIQTAVRSVLTEGKQGVNVELRTVTEGGAGGYGVPIDFHSPVTNMIAPSVVMSLPGIRRDNASSDRVRYPRLGNATVSATAEAATLTAAASDIDAVDVPMIKYSTIDYLSSELVEDFSVNALAAFGGNLLRNLAAAVDNALLEGLGGIDALGIRNTPGANSTSQAGLPTDVTKFRDAEYELRNDNANPVVWVMHPRTWNVLAKLVTGIASDKTTLIAPDPREDTGAALFGYPVRMTSQITLTEGATSVGSWAALLDTSQLVVIERRPPTLEVSRDFAFDTDRVAVRATWRGGLGVLNPEAVSLVTDVRAA